MEPLYLFGLAIPIAWATALWVRRNAVNADQWHVNETIFGKPRMRRRTGGAWEYRDMTKDDWREYHAQRSGW